MQKINHIVIAESCTPPLRDKMLSHHDVEVEFEGQPRISLLAAPYGWELSCIKFVGWQLFAMPVNEYDDGRILATEKGMPKLSIWVKGVQIL